MSNKTVPKLEIFIVWSANLQNLLLNTPKEYSECEPFDYQASYLIFTGKDEYLDLLIFSLATVWKMCQKFAISLNYKFRNFVLSESSNVSLLHPGADTGD